MSTSPLPQGSVATPLAYEVPSGDAPIWRAMRFAVIAFAGCVILRHTAYWIGQYGMLTNGPFLIALTCAILEAAVLIPMAAFAESAGRQLPSRSTLRIIAMLAGVFLVVNAIAFLFDLVRVGGTSPRSIVWQLASRAQLWIVPVMVILAAIRTRRG